MSNSHFLLYTPTQIRIATPAEVSMADSEMVDDRQWSGVEDAVDDPEELRVIFCALDSYLLVEEIS